MSYVKIFLKHLIYIHYYLLCASMCTCMKTVWVWNDKNE